MHTMQKMKFVLAELESQRAKLDKLIDSWEQDHVDSDSEGAEKEKISFSNFQSSIESDIYAIRTSSIDEFP